MRASLIASRRSRLPLANRQGTRTIPFLESQLRPQDLEERLKRAGHPLTLEAPAGYKPQLLLHRSFIDGPPCAIHAVGNLPCVSRLTRLRQPGCEACPGHHGFTRRGAWPFSPLEGDLALEGPDAQGWRHRQSAAPPA